MPQSLTGASVAAVVAALVSLPLHSPSDAFFSTAAVVLASLFLGLIGGVLWWLLASRPNARLKFALIWLIGLAGVIVANALMGREIDRMDSFGIPLAIIVFGLSGAAVVLADRFPPLRSWRVTGACMIVALALGIGLAREGDQASGRLELPPRAVAPLVTPYHTL